MAMFRVPAGYHDGRKFYEHPEVVDIPPEKYATHLGTQGFEAMDEEGEAVLEKCRAHAEAHAAAVEAKQKPPKHPFAVEPPPKPKKTFAPKSTPEKPADPPEPPKGRASDSK